MRALTRATRPAALLRAATPALIYLALAVFLSWPTALRLTTAVPGNGYDSWQNMWNYWWLRKALLEGLNPFYTTMLQYPEGVTLLLHTLNPINFLVSLPVHAVLGLVAAYNFAVIFSLTMAGLCAYALARDVGAGRPAALVGGAAFATCAFLLAQPVGGHMNMLAAWPLPLAVLALRRAQAAPTPRRVGIAGAAIAFTMLADWQFLLFALIWAGWYALAQIWERRDWRAALPSAAAVVVALAMTSPLIVATAQASAAVPTAATQGGPDFRREQSVDVADLLIPSQLHPLWGLAAEQMQSYKAETHIQNKTAYLGLVTLLLAAAGLRRREGGFWLLTALVFILLAMGPVLQVGGWNTGLPLPGGLIFELPLVRIFRYPMRFIAPAMLALAMLAALGAQRLIEAAARRRGGAEAPAPAWRSPAIAALLIGLLVLDNLTIPYPLIGVYIPQIYNEMAADDEPYAVLEAPIYARSNPFYMLYQVVHNKPLVGGYTSRRIPYALIDELPIMRQLAFAAPAPDIVGRDIDRIAASVLSYFNVRYLTLHSTGGALRYGTMLRIASAAAGGVEPRRDVASVVAPDALGASGLRRSFTAQNEVPAGTVLIYEVTPPADPVPFLGIGAGWSDPTPPVNGVVTRTSAGEAELLLYSAQGGAVSLTLDIAAAAPGALIVSVGATPVARVELAGDAEQVEIPLSALPGMTPLRLTTAGALTLARAEVR